MRSLFFTILITLFAAALLSCKAPEQAAYHGYLYFAQGSYLMRFSLRDASLSVVANLGDKTIRDVSRFGPDRLLIAELASINRKVVPRISWIDVKTGQHEALYSGVLARHLDHPGIIIYDDGLKLFAVSLLLGSGADLEVYSHRLNQVSRIIKGPEGTVLFESTEAGEHLLWSYDAVTGRLRELDALAPICRLDGAVWIDTLERLACWDSGYVLVGLDGMVDRKLPLPDEKKFFALAFVSDQNALILKESWHSLLGSQENSAVWIHDIESGESQRLAKNQNLGASVVYTDF